MSRTKLFSGFTARQLIGEWSADELAEAIPYEPFLNSGEKAALYGKLWRFVGKANETGKKVPNANKIWSSLNERERRALLAGFVTDNYPEKWEKYATPELKAQKEYADGRKAKILGELIPELAS